MRLKDNKLQNQSMRRKLFCEWHKDRYYLLAKRMYKGWFKDKWKVAI